MPIIFNKLIQNFDFILISFYVVDIIKLIEYNINVASGCSDQTF